MSIRLCTMAVAGAGLLALAACNGSNNNSNGPGPIQNQFGNTFQNAFNQGATDEPVTDLPGDFGPPNLTEDPIDF